jgi:Flp pilus assembly protein TadD
MFRTFTLLLTAFFAWPTVCVGQADRASDLDLILTEAKHAEEVQDFRGAAASYKKAVQLHPEIAELWGNLGVMQYQSDDSREAIKSLLKAKQLKASLFVPDFFLGLSYLRLEAAGRAVPYLISALAKNASDPQVYLALGRAHFALGELLPAAKAYTKAVRLDPSNGSAWFGMGVAYLEMVERDSRTLSQTDRTSPFGQVLLAASLVRQRRFREAEGVFKAVASLPSRPPCLHATLGLLYLQEEKLDEAHTEFIEDERPGANCGLAELGLAGLAIANGSYLEAQTDLQRIWDRDTGFVTGHYPEITEALQRSQVAAFESFLSERRLDGGVNGDLFAAVSGPSPALRNESPTASPVARSTASREPSLKAAEALNASGKYDQCAQRLQGRVESGTPQELALLCACSFNTGRYSLTSRASEVWLTKAHSDSEALFWSIQANQKLAVDAFMRFEQINPDSSRTHILLGDLYRQRKRFEEAQTEYLAALKLEPGNLAAITGLAWAYRYNSKLEEAKSTCDTALMQKPEDPELNLLQGEVLVSLHDYSGAEPYLRKALNAKPQMRPHVHALLGKVDAETGRAKDAIAELRAGLESDEDGSLHYQLAMLYRQTGNTSESSLMMAQSKELARLRRKRAEIAVQGTSAESGVEDGP